MAEHIPPSEGVEVSSTPFQQRVKPWLDACFGPVIAGDKTERNHRLLEECLETVQACGCTASEAHQLVEYVFNRPPGEPVQEVGGLMLTLAALCLARGLDMHEAGEIELARVWTMTERIRAKQAAKPKHSPLPGTVDSTPRITTPAQVDVEVFPPGTPVHVVVAAAIAFRAKESTPQAAARRGKLLAAFGASLREVEALPDQ